MTDSEILKKLNNGSLSWTLDNFTRVKDLGKKGLTEYIADMHSGQWRLTESGKSYLKNSTN